MPDFLEAADTMTVLQHRYLNKHDQLVELPTTLPAEIAMLWVANRDTIDSEQSTVISQVIENRCRDYNVHANILLDCKLYIPNIANLMTRDREHQLTISSQYAFDHRRMHAFVSRLHTIYLLLLPLIALLLCLILPSISEQVSQEILPDWIPREFVEIFTWLLMLPILSEISKRLQLTWDGQPRLVIRQNSWVNFWWSFITSVNMGGSTVIKLLNFLLQFTMGSMSLPLGVFMHIIMVSIVHIDLLKWFIRNL